MELKVSSRKLDLSPADDVSDPEEKEVSEDDDDDRNHKHRRRDGRSQSLERESQEPVFSRPYRKRSKPYENGNTSTSFNKRRLGISSYSHGPPDSGPRIRAGQILADSGPGRGRGKEAGFWSQRDSRFGSAEIASQLVQHSMPSNMFAGRGPHNPQSTSWNTFGMVPALPNGSLDPLHPMGLQGTLRQPLHPAMNMGIPRQRCRDFEERGFCLRGDMCPMEHGVNRIVIEDVQGLSQFNLPVSLPNAHLLGTTSGQGPLPAVNVPTGALSTKNLITKSSKFGMNGDGMGLNDALADGSVTAVADVYDPDQPLWANDGPETSAAMLSLDPSTLVESETSLDMEPSDHSHFGLSDAFARSQSSSVWGRIGGPKNRIQSKEKVDPVISSSTFSENEATESFTSTHGAAYRGKRMNANDNGQQFNESSIRAKVGPGRTLRKPSQKALRTLFVNGIPQKDNRREALLSHFQKFGEVIDIYIPLNSERAFVQFSKREEAEAALRAPDAVMGNRFIRLWWANRDSILDDGTTGCSSSSLTTRVLSSAAPQPPITGKVRENPQSAACKSSIAHSSVVTGPAPDHAKAVAADAPKAPPPVQKKLESLELLKEEIRKKQEMLDQKRNEFRRQLDKLEKQASGPRDEQASDQTAKRHEVGSANGSAKVETSKSGHGPLAASPAQAEGTAGYSRSLENVVLQSPKSTGVLQESTTPRPSIRLLAPAGAPFIVNRFKLDNRPTAFRVMPPLPSGLANVTVLKEHFSTYGDLSTVELEKMEQVDDNSNESEASVMARICFTTRRAAEKAFLGGKCWQGHNLQFTWVTSSSSGKDVHKENPTPLKQSSDADVQPAAEAGPAFPRSSDADVQPASAADSVSRSSDADVQPAAGESASDSGKVESGDPEQKDNQPDDMDPGNLGSSSASVSSGKLSP